MYQAAQTALLSDMTYRERYDHIREQTAYARRVESFGLNALLAPYALRTRISQQRTSEDVAAPAPKALLPRR